MPGVETLRYFVNQRLTAAAEEIFGVFERTIAEYEEQLCRCKEENERQQKLLDDVQLHFHRADTQQLFVEQEVHSEQQEWSSSLDQEDTEPLQIKEEEEELWSSQEGREEFNTISFQFAHVSVKTENDEEKPQISQLHEIQSEGMKTGADGEDCEGPEQASNSEPERLLHSNTQGKTGDGSEAETDDSDGWRVTKEHDYGLNCVEDLGKDRSNNAKKSHRCSQCSKTFRRKCTFFAHMRTHHTEKLFGCPKGDKKCVQKSDLTKHVVIHKEEKPFCCSRCGKRFNQMSMLKRHMIGHTAERPFRCSECGEKFSQKIGLNTHMMVHRVEKPYSCSLCDKTFNHRSSLATHMMMHTGEKPFSCSQCDKKFYKQYDLEMHMMVHRKDMLQRLVL